MDSLLGTFLAAGAAGFICYLVIGGIRTLFGDESGSHDPNAPKEAGEARDQYFMEKARKKWEILDKKKEI
jgi:hypothetical protein